MRTNGSFAAAQEWESANGYPDSALHTVHQMACVPQLDGRERGRRLPPMSDDAYALFMALSAIAAAAALWHRIQEARIAKRLKRLLDEKGIEIKSAATPPENEPPPK